MRADSSHPSQQAVQVPHSRLTGSIPCSAIAFNLPEVPWLARSRPKLADMTSVDRSSLRMVLDVGETITVKEFLTTGPDNPLLFEDGFEDTNLWQSPVILLLGLFEGEWSADQCFQKLPSRLRKHPGKCKTIEYHRYPEHRAEVFFAGFVTQYLLGNHGPRPAAQQCE
jgi:hypothetical protein